MLQVKGLRDANGSPVTGRLTIEIPASRITILSQGIGTLGENSPLAAQAPYVVDVKNGAARAKFLTPSTTPENGLIVNTFGAPVVYDPEGKELASTGNAVEALATQRARDRRAIRVLQRARRRARGAVADRTAVDPDHGQHLDRRRRHEHLVRAPQAVDGERRLPQAQPEATRRRQHAITGDATEDRAVGRGRHERAPRDGEHVRGGAFRHEAVRRHVESLERAAAHRELLAHDGARMADELERAPARPGVARERQQRDADAARLKPSRSAAARAPSAGSSAVRRRSGPARSPRRRA
jgi:hypothetical protein